MQQNELQELINKLEKGQIQGLGYMEQRKIVSGLKELGEYYYLGSTAELAGYKKICEDFVKYSWK